MPSMGPPQQSDRDVRFRERLLAEVGVEGIVAITDCPMGESQQSDRDVRFRERLLVEVGAAVVGSATVGSQQSDRDGSQNYEEMKVFFGVLDDCTRFLRF